MTAADMFRIGIDLGGTKTEGVLLDPRDAVLVRERRFTPLAEGYQAILESVVRLVRDLAARLPEGANYRVGVGIPGSVDAVTGLVRNANSVCLIGRPFQADLERLLGRRVGVRNDADCFTLAECRMGAGVGHQVVFGVIMGTGCGGGICLDGVVREGPHRICGEWGHVSVDPAGAPCYCGNRGCIETKISGSGVEAAYLARNGVSLTMEEIVAGARRGDARALLAFDAFLDDFGRSLGGLISVLDPDAVVLGGGLSNIEELYHAGVERVRHYAFHDDLRTPILKHRLGDSAGVFGAAWIGI
ncbi:ROK family protein [Geomonas nitrogeniifigens]|uniref:ROK family protein n=1 Tax=Geomonas diazotrophica TaxID=2843197 RepID=A0ABX8JQV2_9BACT|nr:ROK family protein [Geomonas nitrogeniifigens]QWV97800.1 ROK family protein [Geomonas nitrogeniifigens]QXE86940.1 ROK family protein [Geomonas nitrogeniifigens]